MHRQSPGMLAAAALFAVALGHVFWLLTISDKGFDLTDEAFNTLLAMFPEQQLGQVMLTGYLTRFLWSMAGESIPVFRMVGMVILLFSLLGTTACAMVYARSIGLKASRFTFLHVAAAAVGTVPFFYKDLYVLVPGYYWLVMVGLLGVQAGFFLLLSGRFPRTAMVCMAIGGFLAFAGKPTSGAGILFLLTITYLILEDRWTYLRVTAGAGLIAGALCLATAAWLGGGLAETFEKFQLGLQYLQLAETNHTFGHSLRTLADALLVTPWKVFLFTQKVTILVTFAAFLVAWRLQRRSRFTIAGILVLSGIELSFHDISHGTYVFYLVSTFAMTLLAAVLAVSATTPDRTTQVRIRAVLVPLLLGLFVAISLVFGTNTGPGNMLLRATVSIALPLMLVAIWSEQSLRQRGVVAVVAVVAVLSGAVMLHRSAADPSESRLGISGQTEPVTFLGHVDPIGLEPAKAEYANAMLGAADAAGWEPGTPLLNLAGHTPGANVVLDAPYVAFPGLLARADNRDAGQAGLAFVVARTNARTLSAAWVLTSDGPRRLDPIALHEAGLFFPCGYRLVGEFPSWEQTEATDDALEIHQLWRPEPGADCTSGA